MKKVLSILVGTMLLGSLCVSAETNPNEDKIKEIKSQIEIKEKELKELKNELKKLGGETSEIKIGDPITIGDYEITIISYSLSKDYEGNDALIVNYKFVNNSDKPAAPFIAVNFSGFQDSVETDNPFMVEGVDFGPGQKELKPGGEIEAQTALGISDLEKPFELEIKETFSFSDKGTVKTTLDLNNLPE